MPTEVEAAQSLTQLIRAALENKPNLVLALPTGCTPLALYRELALLCAGGELSFHDAHTFALDELKGVPPEDPASFHAYLQRQFHQHVDVHPWRIHFFDGMARDPQAQCDRYERELAEVGGIDLAIVGIGSNGHVAFNEPGPALQARTHLATLTPQTREANASLFGDDPANVPLEAYTIGMGTLMKARQVALIATGARKAEVLARALTGPVTTLLPASLLQLHPNVAVFADDAARGRLPMSAPAPE